MRPSARRIRKAAMLLASLPTWEATRALYEAGALANIVLYHDEAKKTGAIG